MLVQKKGDAIGAEIDFKNVHDITFWSKKWEISPNQLVQALLVTKSKKIVRIEAFLRARGVSV